MKDTFIALLSPEEACSLSFAYSVSPIERFYEFPSAFHFAAEASKLANPEEWNLDDVFTRLESDGWKIEAPAYVSLTY